MKILFLMRKKIFVAELVPFILRCGVFFTVSLEKSDDKRISYEIFPNTFVVSDQKKFLEKEKLHNFEYKWVVIYPDRTFQSELGKR